jgi:hypothetical protein
VRVTKCAWMTTLRQRALSAGYIDVWVSVGWRRCKASTRSPMVTAIGCLWSVASLASMKRLKTVYTCERRRKVFGSVG